MPYPTELTPHTPWSADRTASPVPAILGVGHSHCPILSLSWWQAAAKAWSLCTSTHLESHQAPLSHGPPEALFWGDPTQTHTGFECWQLTCKTVSSGLGRQRERLDSHPPPSAQTSRSIWRYLCQENTTEVLEGEGKEGKVKLPADLFWENVGSPQVTGRASWFAILLEHEGQSKIAAWS